MSDVPAVFLQVVTNYEDLLSQATGIEALEGWNIVVDSPFSRFSPLPLPLDGRWLL